MIVLALNREPVVHALTGPFQGCTVTLRRLTSNEFAEAKDAALALLRDSSKLVELLEHHDLRPAGRKIRDLLKDPMFMAGVGEWLGAVECGVRAITGWTGILDEARRPVPVGREPMEALFLAEPFLNQVLPQIDAAAQLLVIEGKGSGVSPNGSPAPGRTASAPNTAPIAGSAGSPAPTASPARRDSSAPRSNTRPRRKRAPPSGD